MKVEEQIKNRAQNKCELCQSEQQINLFLVSPKTELSTENQVLLCSVCTEQIENPEQVDSKHWRCLNESMWSEVDAVKVLAYRMLNQLKGEGWPIDLLEMMYLEDETIEWAKQGMLDEQEESLIHKDSNGAILTAGDTVVLIKDLNVKGANFTAKRGTAVRNISLVYDNENQIEGRVDGQQIVILTQFVKKSN